MSESNLMKLTRRKLATGIGLCIAAPMRTAIGQSSTIEWKPTFRFDGELFPSFVLANATRSSNTPAPPNVFGDRMSSLGIEVKAPRAGARVRVAISIDGIAQEGTIEQALSAGDQASILLPTLRYDFGLLSRMVQPATSSARFQVFVDDTKIGDEVKSVRVRSVNDTPIATYKDGRATGDYAYMMAAFVNENHPLIEQILQGALRLPQPVVTLFSGYQAQVIPQVFAIWYFLQRSGFAYTSITTPSAMQDGVSSQHVRFIDDSVRVRQANCIDGTVLFASILRKIGIDPLIVLVPGHAFLGFYLDGQRRQIAFLETTMMTSTNPFVSRNPNAIGTALARLFQNDPRMRQSAAAFDNALDVATQKFAAAEPGIKSRSQYYALIDVDRARRAGVQAISR
ncbi:MAG: hypothetical protein JNM79_05975 [Burkholderiales bacterium]|nr:hypothetical protein [Burkholderiales bacterium]